MDDDEFVLNINKRPEPPDGNVTPPSIDPTLGSELVADNWGGRGDA